MSETYLTCPDCGQSGFLKLSAHRCQGKQTPAPEDHIPDATKMVDVVPAEPGAAEAEAILADYAEFRTGAVAWLRMGFRLIAVKQALPHGQFRAWCDKYLPGIKKTHFSNAKMVAEQMSARVDIWKIQPGTIPSDGILAEIVDGRDRNQLILESREMKEDPDNYQAKCEAMWEADPELREQWEPRVLCGEFGYGKAYAGMQGASYTTRPPVRYDRKIQDSGRFLPGWIERSGGWENIPEPARESLIAGLKETLALMPDAVRKMLIGKGNA